MYTFLVRLPLEAVSLWFGVFCSLRHWWSHLIFLHRKIERLRAVSRGIVNTAFLMCSELCCLFSSQASSGKENRWVGCKWHFCLLTLYHKPALHTHGFILSEKIVKGKKCVIIKHLAACSVSVQIEGYPKTSKLYALSWVLLPAALNQNILCLHETISKEDL